MTLPKRYGSIGCAAGLAALLSFIGMSVPRGPAQPIAFNHKVHIETASLNCQDCHLTVEKSAAATIPGLEVCQTCHNEEPLSKSPEEKRLLQYVAEKKEIAWVQITSVPEQVYFSHRRHVSIGGVECQSCHGNVAAMSLPVSDQGTPVTMDACMNCHRQRKVTNDCLACHR